MSDSRDLRKRILKMREINNFDVISDKTFGFDTQDSVLINKNKENDTRINVNKIINKNTVIKKPKISSDKISDNVTPNSIDHINTSYDAQFKLLANKFNEAVEVILELSDRVKQLEKTVCYKDKRSKNISRTLPELKLVTFIILIMLFISGIIYLPFDSTILKLILSDISSLI